LPTGFQLLAPATADDRLYNAGAALERLLEEQWGGTILTQAPALEGAAR
jgi:aspartyl-tRNA(Asn)/glutamyl-tRNA(Gln) amidotransferase subunit A